MDARTRRRHTNSDQRFTPGKLSTGVMIAAVLPCAVACASGPESGTGQGTLPDTEWLSGADPEEVLQSSFCGSPRPGESPLRRLSNLEYENTLVDLGFDETSVETAVAALPNEPESLGFRNAASTLTVTSLLAEKYKAIAEQLTAKYDYPCHLDDQSACAAEMIQRAGSRMYRRPLSDEETEAYRALYEQSREENTHQDAMGWVARTMLQSPHFLYRVEIPDPDGVTRVVGYEMANRLSYMIWKSSPDQELLRAASAGDLESEDEVLEQTARMLQDPRAKNLIDFFDQWLDLDDLHDIEKEGPTYEGVSSQLASLLRAEAHAFLLDLLRTPGASYDDLLTADYTFANAELVEHYDLAPVSDDAFVRVSAPGRSGILTQGMLVAQDGPTRTSIVRRGLKIRTDLLCQIVPAPPDTVDLTLDGIGQDLTQSERLERHSESPSCSGCHRLMDPIGRSLEGFDAVGRARTVDEYENPVDAVGELTGTLDADGPLNGATDLALRLSESVEARQCYMIQNLRFHLGREVQSNDLCTQAQVYTRWQQSEFSLIGLLLAVVQSDAFLYKGQRQEQLYDSSAPNDENDEGARP